MEPAERRRQVPPLNRPRSPVVAPREVQDGTIVSRMMDVDSGEERVKAIVDEINSRNLERSVGTWLGSQLKRRGWGRWRAAEALGVRLPKLSSWLDGSADPTEKERERITSVFGPGLPLGPAEAHSAGRR